MAPPTILWLRRDLRRGDLPALGAAHDAARTDDGPGEVAVVFDLDPVLWGGAGDARRAWLAESLKAADAAYDGRLCVREGDPVTVVPALAAELGRLGARLP
jgi:deoxyribodipyrimidine photo-lyase